MRCAQFVTRFWVTPLKRVAARFAVIAALLTATAAAAFGASQVPLDSQQVLLRYQRAIVALPTPKAVIFTYALSQAGPRDLEQTHRIYRSGDRVRDEMLTSEGQSLKRKTVRISRYPDRYAIARLAPHASEYAFLFQGMARVGGRTAYEYTAVPLQRGGAYVVDAMSIDSTSFLPLSIRFTLTSGSVKATGELRYARTSTYWMPQLAVVEAPMRNGTARERIAFGGYRFPTELPESTFRSRKPVAPPTALPVF